MCLYRNRNTPRIFRARIEHYLKKGEPAQVGKLAFRDALSNYVRHHDRTTILRGVAGKATRKQIEAELEERNYVNQLNAIGLDYDDILEAVNDFLSSSINRTAWSSKGMISESSLETFEKELVLTWRNKRRRTRVRYYDKTAEEQGQLIYTDCIEHSTALDGLQTPQTFVRGSWHALADDLVVGWHPKYETILKTRQPSARDATGVTAMSTLTHETRCVQNPALGAVLLWRYAVAWTKHSPTSGHPPLPHLFLVLPILFHQDTFDILKGTNRPTGLHGFAEKFSRKAVCKSDVLVSIHARALSWRELTWESLQVAVYSRLVTLLPASGTVVPLTEARPTGLSAQTRALLVNAEKLGEWCSRLTLFEIAAIMKVQF